MWTTEQANRAAGRMGLLATLVFVAIGIGHAVRGDWLSATILGTAAVASHLLDRRRTRRWAAEARLSGQTSDLALTNGRASDEREAYIQLRAWANVGQAAMVVGFLPLAVVLAIGDPGPLWILAAGPVAVLGGVQYFSLQWLQRRT